VVPELPDVEIFRRYLRRTTLHEKVEKLSVERAAGRILKGTSARRLGRRVRGRRLDSTRRHGKYLFVGLGEGSEALVLHFGMSGFLVHYRDPEDAPDHARVVLSLGDGSHLAYGSQRLLGQVALTADPNAWVEEHDLGPDALRVGWKVFVERVSGRSGALKSTLMDQSVLAGIGNVYSDEILFQARLHPKTTVGRLDEDELRALGRRVRSVLKGAIRYRADPERIPLTWLLPHREPGARCPRCRGRVKRLRVGGRSAWICAACQKKRR
jgi:formamidopyrimidine-DNA glycosylase